MTVLQFWTLSPAMQRWRPNVGRFAGAPWRITSAPKRQRRDDGPHIGQPAPVAPYWSGSPSVSASDIGPNDAARRRPQAFSGDADRRVGQAGQDFGTPGPDHASATRTALDVQRLAQALPGGRAGSDEQLNRVLQAVLAEAQRSVSSIDNLCTLLEGKAWISMTSTPTDTPSICRGPL